MATSLKLYRRFSLVRLSGSRLRRQYSTPIVSRLTLVWTGVTFVHLAAESRRAAPTHGEPFVHIGAVSFSIQYRHNMSELIIGEVRVATQTHLKNAATFRNSLLDMPSPFRQAVGRSFTSRPFRCVVRQVRYGIRLIHYLENSVINEFYELYRLDASGHPDLLVKWQIGM